MTASSNTRTNLEVLQNLTQQPYSSDLYELEVACHNESINEYKLEFTLLMYELSQNSKPNVELYKQQPYLTPVIRCKLIDFLLKMSIRLKILPFVFFKAVKLFDRYCSKRIVLLDQAQLIITTCLWIAAKVSGGNNHFVNLNNVKQYSSDPASNSIPSNIKTINDLGYGCGGKFLGPTERFRLPKLHELVKLCGAKCKYDLGMFKQMEVHILQTLDWSVNEPGIEEYIALSHEFSTMDEQVNNEAFKVKEYLSYVSLYLFELLDCDIVDLSRVILDLVNEIFCLDKADACFQKLNDPNDEYNHKVEFQNYVYIKKSLIKAIINSTDYIVKLFESQGPQMFIKQIFYKFKNHQTFGVPCGTTNPAGVPVTAGTPGTTQGSSDYYYLPSPAYTAYESSNKGSASPVSSSMNSPESATSTSSSVYTNMSSTTAASSTGNSPYKRKPVANNTAANVASIISGVPPCAPPPPPPTSGIPKSGQGGRRASSIPPPHQITKDDYLPVFKTMYPTPSSGNKRVQKQTPLCSYQHKLPPLIINKLNENGSQASLVSLESSNQPSDIFDNSACCTLLMASLMINSTAGQNGKVFTPLSESGSPDATHNYSKQQAV